MNFSAGETVGDYRVIELIGSGGMGTVYKVQHLISDRIEAMKVVLPNLVNSPVLLERFMREIKVQARLCHPNITSLHNAMRLGDTVMMIMEYVEGTTLHSHLRGTSLEQSTSVEITLQVLSALAYSHAQGVVHRDIKPANIMITSSGGVKLMDFGIAQAADQHDHLTRTGAAVGSVYYMSPEQVQGIVVDHRSDLYSLGVTLYEMVTAQKPINGDTSWAVMNGHLNQAIRAPGSVNPKVSTSLSLAILKALEKRPEDRYQTAEQFAGILQVVKSRAGTGQQPLETILMNLPAAPGESPRTPTSYTPSSSQPNSRPVQSSAASIGVKTPTPPSGSGAVQFETAQIDKIKKELAAYLGPMAKILVDRTARKASSLQHLYDLLAPEIPEGPERKKFLAGRPR